MIVMPETPIETLLKQQIAHHGPISLAALMAEALGHPVYGYYRAQDPFGSQGDFITSPEISQLFGEMIGIWCAYSWQQMGCLENVALVELGPGRGTLMKDILRATQHVPNFHQNISVHMVETSAALSAQQQTNLAGCHPRIHWHHQVSSLPECPLVVIANEFFDALPIHQYVYTPRGWHERMVGLHPDTGALQFTLVPSVAPVAITPLAEGQMIEKSPVSEAIMGMIAEKIAMHRGVALVIDYGYDHAASPHIHVDTLQAVKQHRYHPVLDRLGEADITAHVDFLALKNKAATYGLPSYGAVSQGYFLKAMGLELRAAKLAEKASPSQQPMIWKAVDRLTAPDTMGELFKVIAITDQAHPLPAGF